MDKKIFDITPVSQMILDENSKIIAANQSACALLQVEREQLVGKHYEVLNLIELDDPIFVHKSTESIIKLDRKAFDFSGKRHELVSIFSISKFSEKMAELQKANLNLQKYIDESNLIFLVLDCNANIRTINRKGRSVLEINEDVVGVNWIDRFIPEEDQVRIREVFEAVRNRRLTFDDYVEGMAKSASGELIYIGWNNTTILNQGEVESILAVGFDLTDRRVHEDRLIFEATKDSMTKAFNRKAGLEIFESEFERAKNEEGSLSICFFDIDNLKEVNDTYGHFEGDRYIREIVAVIRWIMNDKDSIVRYGGDEFLVIFPGADSEKTHRLADRLMTHISEMNQKDLFRYSLSLSYGVSSIDSYLKHDHLGMLADADSRMYEMKKNKRKKRNR